jgi:RimJ/RimL family protein N-acetyltransferase
MNHSISIRKASFADLETLRRFEQGVIEAERPFDPTLKPDPNYYYDLDQMMSDPDVHLVVAVCDEQVIGSGYARIEKAKHYLKHPLHSYLGFMYVDPQWRGKKINQLIIEELKQWSFNKNINELRLDVYVENAPAIKAYEKAGFSKLMMQMRLYI